MLQNHIDNPYAEQQGANQPGSDGKTDQIHTFVTHLVRQYADARRAAPVGRKLDEMPRGNLARYETWLAQAYHYFSERAQKKLSISLASEWILDNYYIIRQALIEIKESLPPGYYRQLPYLADGPYKNLPRIYALAGAVLSYQHDLFEPIELETILVRIQEQVALTTGELWALPIFLRYRLIESLAHTLVAVIQPSKPPLLPELIFTPNDSREDAQAANHENAAGEASDRIANIILSFRAISELDWKDFFEAVSALEATLRQDPAGVYKKMDFATRDTYRNEIEELSFASGRPEAELAELALKLAQEAASHSPIDKVSVHAAGALSQHESDQEVINRRAVHIGNYIIGNGRAELEQRIGYRPDLRTAIQRWAFRYPTFVYLSSVAAVMILLFVILAFPAHLPEMYSAIFTPEKSFPWEPAFNSPNPMWLWIVLILLTLALTVPVLTIATNLVNWIITILIRPRVLPKLNFKKGIPTEFTTLVVIPALITSETEIDSLVQQLELHYLRNPEEGLRFGLLTDFSDADRETEPEDEFLVNYALAKIEALNRAYPTAAPGENSSDGVQRFMLYHRKRLWNPSEGKWMGWERKRGKLHELNQLLRGGENLSFITPTQLTPREQAALQQVRFVITLDADTILPIGAGHRLVGTLAHPLNRAVFDPESGVVRSGYTVLQPRMEIHPKSANLSWFTRIFAGDAGLDLYTLAVSDAYQDLFGEGIYVGKGIYDVDAFQRSVDADIPENRVLSHDLLEGLMGRVGLVADITMVEDYPQNYLIQILRQRRWIRGDWQLLPWLISPRRFGVHFSVIDRWKIFDNLIRSLLAPALVVIFVLGLIFLPSLAGLWTALVALALGIPLLTGLARSSLQILADEPARLALRPLGWNFLRWILAISFLIYEAYISVDAIFTTLYRLFISRRNLLQWTTAAQTTRLFRLNRRQNVGWQKMGVSVIAALILTFGLLLISDLNRRGLAMVFFYAAIILLLWMFSPLIVWFINRPILGKTIPLDRDQEFYLQQIARQTWGFFERFVGPEDHWLPPDHYQEFPAAKVAHRTSPTNMGLLLTSTWAAYDLGYLDHLALVTRLETTTETFTQLERFRGHFLNWYDTLSLKPLKPAYISAVDSGNLAASMIVTAQACQALPADPILRWDVWQTSYLAALSTLKEAIPQSGQSDFSVDVEEIHELISSLQAEILGFRALPERWYTLFQKASGTVWKDISERLMDWVESDTREFAPGVLGELKNVSAHVERHHTIIQRTITELMPWLPLFDHLPALFIQPSFLQIIEALHAQLPHHLSLAEIAAHTQSAAKQLSLLRDLSAEETRPTQAQLNGDVIPETAQVGQEQISPEAWLDAFEEALHLAQKNAIALLERLTAIRAELEKFVDEMDFGFLYNPQRRIFHIGYNLDSGMLDLNYYDLLASEARITSIVAIAKGDVPPAHWLYLSRPVTRVNGSNILLSWSGTMFEYLMPAQILRSYPGTLLAETVRGAVVQQIAYGKSKRVPWGISESGFYRFDASQNYQYRAFGVPGLGFKRGLSNDLVIAPYASLMAVAIEPQAVINNLVELSKHKMFGAYGFYEALDFTSDRLPLDEKSAVVGEYMAHHQGMIMMALANYFCDDIMVKRMHSDPRIRSVELLLQEQISHAAPQRNPAAEDVKGVRRLQEIPENITPWQAPVQTSIPQMHLLSNGSYKVMISNMGGGYSSWRDIDLTRWQADGVLDSWGNWIYIQEMDQDEKLPSKAWSAAHQPIPGDPSQMQVTYFAHMAVFRRAETGIDSTLEVTVAPNAAVELRRVHLHNNFARVRRMRLTSYGEVILAPQAADVRHPAFNKLFIESEYLPEMNLQIFTRRPRSPQEAPVYLGHMLVYEGNAATARHEANRDRFIGRLRSLKKPAALEGETYLSGSSGATLDPIFCLGTVVELGAHENKQVCFVTLAAESREEVLALAWQYQNWDLIEPAFHQASVAAQTWLGKQDINSQTFKDILQTLSALIYPWSQLRAAPQTIAANRLGQPGLWRFGISGDDPILLVEIDDPQHLDVIRETLQVYKYLRSRRIKMDLVLLNCQPTDYGAELNGLIHRLVNEMNAGDWLNQRSGICVLFKDQMHLEETTLLQAAARILLRGENGALSAQLPGYATPVQHLPEFIPTLRRRSPTKALPGASANKLNKMTDLQFFNGYGGFSQDGREYIIEVNRSFAQMEAPAARGMPISEENVTPAPWVNVIGYPEFGFMVSEAGSQCTWAVNSGENRLTPWSNDPVRDPSGEAIYLRDEETGEVWSPTPLPCGAEQPYRVTHGAGYTLFQHNSHGMQQQLRLFASPEDPVKILHLKVRNTLARKRRITATYYVEWVLGTTRALNMPYIIPEYYADQECMTATNPYNVEFGERVAFMIASKPIHGLTADRIEFLGRGGSPALPAALLRLGLETRITPGQEPCGVLQVHLDLQPGGEEAFYFVLGEGENREQALALAQKYHQPKQARRALESTQAFWEDLLGVIQVKTPEPSTDIMLNQWALYQALSCRIWGRSAFYQSSGAFGFRDQLQDVLALLTIDPTISRGHILNAAQHQFEEGDVLHWWHPPSGRGIRTRITDNLLWLPYVTALYVETTGDGSILDEKIAFLTAPPLADGEDERYGHFPLSQHSATLMEHCQRAIKKGATHGAHGLPLIGTGDWNDGLNLVGDKGRGESIWLAWFLYDVLTRFASLCDRRGDCQLAQEYRHQAQAYAEAVEQSGWDGSWYRRAYDDEGAPLGSHQSRECQIDAIAQSWSVLSQAGNPQRSVQAMQSALERLVRPQDRLSLLLTPPFDQTARNPGYIKGYLPGTRENGGQYTHAAIWTAWAFSKLGDGQQAGELFKLLNPVLQSDTADMACVYRVEPYAVCADVYSVHPYVRRGGWTWYTGSAAWMYRLGVEALLGLHKVGDQLQINPVIPPSWDGFELRYRFGGTFYFIQVYNPEHVASQVEQVRLDGQVLEDGFIPLVDDHQDHHVEVRMGKNDQ